MSRNQPLSAGFARRGSATDGYPALHTILVNDLRQRSGDTASMARVIAALPFNDTGDSTAFADNYGCQATVRRVCQHNGLPGLPLHAVSVCGASKAPHWCCTCLVFVSSAGRIPGCRLQLHRSHGHRCYNLDVRLWV